MHDLPSTLDLKSKRYPNGLIRKFIPRFCVRGDRKIEGVDFFESFAAVVNWVTIRLLLIISIHINLSTMQVYYTSSFFHSELNDEVYIDMTCGFTQDGKCLKLKRSLYELLLSQRNFYLYLKNKLEKFEFVQSKANSCLFFRPDIICLVYVDDCIFLDPDSSNFETMLTKLRVSYMSMQKKDAVAGFLCVSLVINSNDGSIELTQTRLTDRIITAMGLDDATSTKMYTEYGKLPKDIDEDCCDTDLNYASVVCILLYLLRHSHPELAFSVSQCARCTFSSKLSHKKALKCIGRAIPHKNPH